MGEQWQRPWMDEDEVREYQCNQGMVGARHLYQPCTATAIWGRGEEQLKAQYVMAGRCWPRLAKGPLTYCYWAPWIDAVVVFSADR